MSTPHRSMGWCSPGGRSRRMQRDKAALEYAGTPQLARAHGAARPARGALLRLGPRRAAPGARAAPPTTSIVDLQPDLGSDRRHPGGAARPPGAAPGWSWPATCRSSTAATLDHLIASRASRAAGDRLSQQLRRPARAAVRDLRARQPRGRRCAGSSRASAARASCSRAPTLLLLEPLNAHALDNVNTPEQYAAAAAELATAGHGGRGRDGCARGGRPAAACTCATSRCCASRPAAAARSCRPARAPRWSCTRSCGSAGAWRSTPSSCAWPSMMNSATGAPPLAEGDTVAFLPPVAGG